MSGQFLHEFWREAILGRGKKFLFKTLEFAKFSILEYIAEALILLVC